MRKLTFSLFLLIGIYVSPMAQKKLDIDHREIKKYVTKQRSDFDLLMRRYEVNDSLLTEKEYALVYFGYSFTPSYCGSFGESEKITDLIKKGILINI